MLSAIDKKILEEDLNFAQSDYPAIINLSNLVASADGVDKIKQLVKDGDIWNCGITDAYRTDPMPFHIEMLSEKVKWTEKDWKQIYPFKGMPDKPLIDKYSSCNHDKCEYDENGNEVNHVNNTGIAIDDICPAWYAKRNNLKNRTKYINQDVYLLLDFIGKY